MNITVDTNVLVRLVMEDDPKQARTARKFLTEASLIAIPSPVLCEFVWVLRKVYRLNDVDIITALRVLINVRQVKLDRPAVEMGIAMLEAGGDFADGVIAHEGRWLGGETYVSFDKEAVHLLQQRGVASRQLR
ncbi:MAG: type II toxin-antitoxin system VapC family toxin [Acidobacteria bacterium]|nr:type II toxin-antitoxin system VapC family toxin [Acidobacteriota bacterium]